MYNRLTEKSFVQVDLLSLSSELQLCYCEFNRNDTISNQQFVKLFVQSVSKFCTYDELVEFVTKEQSYFKLTPKYSGSFVLLNHLEELSRVLECPCPILMNHLEARTFSPGEYTAYYVHVREEILSCGPLSELHTYVGLIGTIIRHEFDIICLVVATSEEDAHATAKLVLRQPLHPLRLFNISRGSDLWHLSLTPMAGTPLSKSEHIFQAGNPLRLIEILSGINISDYLDLTDGLGSIFHAGAFFDESTNLVCVLGQYHRLTKFIVFCDVRKSIILDNERMLALASRENGDTASEKIFNKIARTRKYKIIHVGYDEILSALCGDRDIAISLENAKVHGISDKLIRSVLEKGYALSYL